MFPHHTFLLVDLICHEVVILVYLFTRLALIVITQDEGAALFGGLSQQVVNTVALTCLTLREVLYDVSLT